MPRKIKTLVELKESLLLGSHFSDAEIKKAFKELSREIGIKKSLFRQWLKEGNRSFGRIRNEDCCDRFNNAFMPAMKIMLYIKFAKETNNIRNVELLTETIKDCLNEPAANRYWDDVCYLISNYCDTPGMFSSCLGEIAQEKTSQEKTSFAKRSREKGVSFEPKNRSSVEKDGKAGKAGKNDSPLEK